MQNHNTQNRLRPLALLVGAFLVTALGVVIWISRPAPPPVNLPAEGSAATEPAAETETAAAVAPVASSPPSALEEQWGIQVSSMTLTNADTVVLLCYKVVAPEKTARLAETNAEVYVIDQASGAKLPMFSAPKEATASTTVPARTARRMMRLAGSFPPAPSRLIEGSSHSLQIPNWNGTLKSGSKVAVVVGSLRTDNLTVE
jgi:hypothetical protein